MSVKEVDGMSEKVFCEICNRLVRKNKTREVKGKYIGTIHYCKKHEDEVESVEPSPLTKQEVIELRAMYGDRWWSIVDNAIYGGR